LITQYVELYNTNRLHSALNYLTPADYLQGSQHVRAALAKRQEVLQLAAERRRAYRRHLTPSSHPEDRNDRQQD
jgi:hypothetical protein